MSLDVSDPIAVEHDALDKVHAALAANHYGLTIGELVAEVGYSRGYLAHLLVLPYFYKVGCRWKHNLESVDERFRVAVNVPMARDSRAASQLSTDNVSVGRSLL